MGLKKWCCWAIILILVFLLGGLTVFYFLSQPQRSGTLYLNHIDGTATIEFDKYGVPLIDGNTTLSKYFALGYVHAQDRLWELHFKKMVTIGRLSEIFGSKSLELDKFHRIIGLYRAANETLKYLSEEELQIAEAYSEGINAYAENCVVYPLEFYIIRTKFEKWTVLDTISILKQTGVILSGYWNFILMRTTIKNRMGIDWAKLFVPYESQNFFPNATTILSDEELKQSNLYHPNPNLYKNRIKFNGQEDLDSITDDQFPTSLNVDLPDYYSLSGVSQSMSNAWAISGKYTKSGKPLLANDPHLGNKIPSHWYLAKMKIRNMTISGGTMVGMPFIYAGKNDYMAWGPTSILPENSDLFEIKMNSNRTHYLYNNHWVPLKIYNETIKIKGANEMNFIVRESHHGPIFDELGQDIGSWLLFGSPTFFTKPIALSWCGYYANDSTLYGGIHAMQAKNIDEFFGAVSYLKSFPLGLIFASEAGDIGFVSSGLFPKRDSILDAVFIKEGWNPKHDWKEGYIQFKDLPKIVNPSKGYIVASNNRVSKSESTKYGIGSTLIPSSRATRITEIIENKIQSGQKMTLEDMRTFQLDNIDIYARSLLPKFINITNTYKKYFFNSTNSFDAEKLEIISSYIKSLDNWDFDFSVDNIQSTIYIAWESEILKQLFIKEYPNDAERLAITGSFPFDQYFNRLVINWNLGKELNNIGCGNSEYFQNDLGCPFIVIDAIFKAQKYLEQSYGKNQENWAWGQVHPQNYPHIPFSQTPLKPFFDRRIISAGNRRTINNGQFKLMSKHLEAGHSANYKMLIDFSNDTNCFYSIDTGQSGDILNSHYDDLMKSHREGNLLNMKLDPISTLTLSPIQTPKKINKNEL